MHNVSRKAWHFAFLKYSLNMIFSIVNIWCGTCGWSHYLDLGNLTRFPVWILSVAFIVLSKLVTHMEFRWNPESLITRMYVLVGNIFIGVIFPTFECDCLKEKSVTVANKSDLYLRWLLNGCRQNTSSVIYLDVVSTAGRVLGY